MVVETLREQWARMGDLDAEVDTIERRLTLWHRQNVASRRIAAIPGVGVLSATVTVATMGDPARVSGRDGSSPPGSVWCLGTAAQAGACACSISGSVRRRTSSASDTARHPLAGLIVTRRPSSHAVRLLLGEPLRFVGFRIIVRESMISRSRS